MQVIRIPFDKTALNHRLTTQYLNKNDVLNEHYDFMPNIDAIPQAINCRKNFETDRILLNEVLTEQYKNMNPLPDTVKNNINLLKLNNTFTITTGHQANIFSGPLYYWYKIIDTIIYSKQLAKKYPDYNFIPLYWMATEDHDFEEINHIHLFGKKYEWQNNYSGATGRMNNQGLNHLLNELKTKLFQNENGKKLYHLFDKAYSDHNNLADASRYWINELLGHTGLIILDPDHPKLKQKLKHIIIQDVTEQKFEPLVNASKEKLEQHFTKLPVNPRNINFFYLDHNLRERIIFEGDHFKVLNTDISFSPVQILELINKHPEKFSPNVIMRPVYQEVILPNLAYIGGTTEIAYWLELKTIFNESKVFFPQLLVRNSVFWIGNTLSKKIKKLGMKLDEMIMDKDTAFNILLNRLNRDNDVENLINNLIEQYDFLKNDKIPQSIKGEIGKKAAMHQKELKKMRKMIHSVLKQENKKQIEQFEKIYDSLFPNNIPQERYENFIPYYLIYGSEFIIFLIENLTAGGGVVNVIEE